MTVAEQRQGRAEVLAADFHKWIPCTTNFAGRAPGNTIAFAIPSQTRAGLFHIASLSHGGRCGCWDSIRRSGRCKHIRALQIVARQFGLLPVEQRTTLARRNGHDTPEVLAA